MPAWALWLVGDLGARIAALDDVERVRLSSSDFPALVGATGAAPGGLATVLERGDGQLLLLADGLRPGASAASSGGDADLDPRARRALDRTLIGEGDTGRGAGARRGAPYAALGARNASRPPGGELTGG